MKSLTATEAIEKESKEHISDLNIVETQIREIQAEKYYGSITFKFKNGILQPVCDKNGTQAIKRTNII